MVNEEGERQGGAKTRRFKDQGRMRERGERAGERRGREDRVGTVSVEDGITLVGDVHRSRSRCDDSYS